ncbi:MULTISPECIES: hypothetical protein [Acinetobacter]|uniref:hypothetical protein n=1 Tax=Acinetobacter TaxID=469 RepID=UPI0002AEBBCB|nr:MULTISPECIES: hypothetical protein [Acinetobacter]ELW91602.1 hypothetical protein ACINWC743_A0332 [Acinetobacter sp. WC-743]MBJ8428607.1 hypothetical protein [Acinetobacter bereziniae]
MVSNGAVTNILKRLPQIKDIIDDKSFSYNLGSKITKGIEMSRGKGVTQLAKGFNMQKAARNCTECSYNIISQLNKTGQKTMAKGVGNVIKDYVDIPGKLKGWATDGWFEIDDLVNEKISKDKESKK